MNFICGSLLLTRESVWSFLWLKAYTWNDSNTPTIEWTPKLWHTHTAECYTAQRMHSLILPSTICLGFTTQCWEKEARPQRARLASEAQKCKSDLCFQKPEQQVPWGAGRDPKMQVWALCWSSSWLAAASPMCTFLCICYSSTQSLQIPWWIHYQHL